MKQKIFIKFIICFSCCFSLALFSAFFSQSFAQNSRGAGSIRANISAKVINNIANIDADSDIFQVAIDKNNIPSLIQTRSFGNNISYQIKSAPLTMTNIIFASADLSKFGENKSNMMIEMKNDEGDVWYVDLKTDERFLMFNKKGDASLQLTPKLVMKKSQVRGVYRAFYYVMILY